MYLNKHLSDLLPILIAIDIPNPKSFDVNK